MYSSIAMLRIFIASSLLICLLPLLSLADSGDAWLKGIPLNQAIRIGSGRQVVIEVSDPDCRFSRRMVRYWDMRHDVSRYVFLVALKNRPETVAKMRYILCASDHEAAYRQVYGGEFDFGEIAPGLHCDDHGLEAANRKVTTKLGIKGTPTYFINGIRIDGAKVGEIERILGGDKYPFDAGDPE